VPQRRHVEDGLCRRENGVLFFLDVLLHN
jgi:hypothetical protein